MKPKVYLIRTSEGRQLFVAAVTMNDAITSIPTSRYGAIESVKSLGTYVEADGLMPVPKGEATDVR